MIRCKRSCFSALFILLLVFTVTACSPLGSVYNRDLVLTIPEPPVLPSAIELYHEGKRGLWIEEHDVANLMLWINEIRETAGR